MTNAVYLRGLFIKTEDELAKSFPDGFVGRFERFACGIADHVLSKIGGQLKTSGISSLVIRFHQRLAEKPNDNRLGMYLAWPFDFSAFVNATDEEKRIQSYNAVREALLWAAELDAWNQQIIENAFMEMRNERYRFQYYTRKSWPDPTGQYRMRIWFSYEMDHLAVYGALFRNRSRNMQELSRVPITKAPLIPRCAAAWTTRGEWTEEKVFVLHNDGWPNEAIKVDVSDYLKQ